MSMGMNPQNSTGGPQTAPPVIIQAQSGPSPGRRLATWLLMLLLIFSLLMNLGMYVAFEDYFAEAEGPSEIFHSGDKTATSKIARIRIEGTIMPPFTGRILKDIKKAKDDDHVKAVLLVIDSPGGLVSDSHHIYHHLTELRDKKPIYVAMQGMAASGGYYVAMGAGEKGKIFAMPTTWTGSIGVIIPHYEATGLAEKVGVKSEPLKTGEFKDALSPFREMTAAERKLWEDIMNQSFEEFLKVIDDNRVTLDMAAVRKLATGQIYTARDAKQLGMIDAIGYEEDALKELKKVANLETARVVSYHHAVGLTDLLLGSSARRDPMAEWRALLEATVPRAMFYCSWAPLVPSLSR